MRRCGPQQHVRFGLFNAYSLGNKCASVQQWIVDAKLKKTLFTERV